MRRFALAVLAMLAAESGLACSGRAFNPEDVITNEPECSANGRFCAIVRLYPVPDFKSETAEVAFRKQGEPSDHVTVAFYEGRRLISTMAVEWGRQMLVADSGRYLVAVRGARGMCRYRMGEDTVLAEIHKADGALVAAFKAIDLLTPYDVERVENIVWEIRPVSDVREILVLHADDQERRIDLATGALLDPKTAIYAPPHATVAAADGTQAKPFEPSECAAAFDAPDVVRISSNELLGQTIDAPAPEYPPVARKAHVALPVLVDVLVSESGGVLCARATAGPFGLQQAALGAVRQWRFRRSRSKTAGEVMIRFEQP